MKNQKILALAGFILLAIPGVAGADDYRDVVRSSNGQIVHDEAFGTCVRTKWITDRDNCATCPAPVAIQQPVVHTVVAKEDRTVYFVFDQTNLTEESMDRLNTLADRLKSASDVEGARVVGYADRIGTVSYNEKLSRKRAEAVRDYLVAHGVVNSNVTKTRWVGKSEPSAQCKKNSGRTAEIDCLQPDRKVEVEIVYRKEVRQ